MPLHLTPELEQRLAQLAAQTGRSPDEIAQEALEEYATHLESLIADIREGEESADREGWLTHEEVVARFEKLLTHKKQLIAAVEEGRAAARRGELVDHEEVMAMMDDIIENG
jgi:predicted transcriptional regulator